MQKRGKVGIQILSIQMFIPDNTLAVIEKLAKIGYDGIEFLNYSPDPGAAKIRKALDSVGIECCGVHIDYAALVNDLPKVLDYSVEIKSPYIVLPRLPVHMRFDDGAREAAEAMYRIGEECKKNGIRLVFHHHDWEIIEHDGRSSMDTMAGILPPDLLAFQAEIFWLEGCGIDPATFIYKYQDRIVSLHINDKKNKAEKLQTELGKGIIDLRSVVNASVKIGVDWYVVEQEAVESQGGETMNIYKSAEYDLKYVRKLLSEAIF